MLVRQEEADELDEREEDDKTGEEILTHEEYILPASGMVSPPIQVQTMAPLGNIIEDEEDSIEKPLSSLERVVNPSRRSSRAGDLNTIATLTIPEETEAEIASPFNTRNSIPNKIKSSKSIPDECKYFKLDYKVMVLESLNKDINISQTLNSFLCPKLL